MSGPDNFFTPRNTAFSKEPPMTTNPLDLAALKPCPFCGGGVQRGPTKKTFCQLHGEPIQRYRIWCSNGHAEVNEVDEAQAIAAWNRRAPGLHPDPVEGDDLAEVVNWLKVQIGLQRGFGLGAHDPVANKYERILTHLTGARS